MGHEGRYEVSNKGRVKSLGRNVKSKAGGTAFIKERILKPRISVHGYLRVALSGGKKKEYPHIHTLVARAFIGKRNGKQTNHLNRDREDNRPENLEYVTCRENATHRTGRGEYTGVIADGKKWRGTIFIDNKRLHLGTFNTPEGAAAAYQEALKEHGLENKYAPQIAEAKLTEILDAPAQDNPELKELMGHKAPWREEPKT